MLTAAQVILLQRRRKGDFIDMYWGALFACINYLFCRFGRILHSAKPSGIKDFEV